MKQLLYYTKTAVLAALCLGTPSILRAQTTTGGGDADLDPGDFVDVPAGDGVVTVKETDYDVPTRGAVLYFSTNGDDINGDGSAAKPWKTLTAALVADNTKIPAGATLIFAEGRYPIGKVPINKALTLQPAKGKEVWLVGSERLMATDWEQAPGSTTVWRTKAGVWTANLKTVAEEGAGNGLKTLPCSASPATCPANFREQLFVNDQPREQVLAKSQVAADKFYVDQNENRIYAGINPNVAGRRIDATVSDQGLVLNAPGQATNQRIVVRGLGFRNFAGGGVQSNDGNFTLENCTFAWGATEGANLITNLDKVLIKGNTFAYNGRLGLRVSGYPDADFQSADFVVEENIFSYNNNMNFRVQWSAGGFKMAYIDDAIIRRNLFNNNYGTGCWMDLDVERVKVLGNVARNNTAVGIFYEVSRGGFLAGNVCSANAAGMKVSGSSGVGIYNNTLVDNTVNLDVSDYNRLNQPDPLEPKKPGETDAEFAARQAAYNRQLAISAAQRARGILYETYEVAIKNNVLAGGRNAGLNVSQSLSNPEPAEDMVSAGALDRNLYLSWTAGKTVRFNNRGAAGASQQYSTLAAFKAATSGFDVNSTEVTNRTPAQLFGDFAGNDFRLKNCAPNTWPLPAAPAVSNSLQIARSIGNAPAFNISGADYRDALGLTAGQLLRLGAEQELAPCGTTPQPQTITFTTTFANAKVGQQLTLATTSTGSPTLPVTYSLVSTPATVATLAGSTLTLTGVGSVTVRASKAGDATYAAATRDTTFAVGQGTPVLTLAPLADQTFGDGPVTLAATSTVAAAGPITYSLGSTPATVATLSGNTLTLVGAGTVTVTASQAGNANYAAAAPVTRSFTVAKAAQTVTFAALPDVDAPDFGPRPAVALAATVAPAAPARPITYSVVSGPATVSGSTLTLTGVGAVTVKARQAGTANYLPAEAQQTFLSLGVAVALNAGGGAFTSTANGVVYAPDAAVASGGTALDRPAVTVANTADNRLFQTERYGEFSYALPLEPGTYQFTLKFAELNFTAANQRVFDVLVENETTPLLANLDVYAAAGGANVALARTFTRPVADGALNLQFRAEAGKNVPQLCALVVRRVADNPAARNAPSLAGTGSGAPTPSPAPAALGAAASVRAAAALSVFPNPNHGEATLTLTAETAQSALVYVYSEQGRLTAMFSVPVHAGDTQFRLPTVLPPGVYALRTRLDGQPVQFKLLVN